MQTKEFCNYLEHLAFFLWKATFELCQIVDKNSPDALLQQKIIEDVLEDE